MATYDQKGNELEPVQVTAQRIKPADVELPEFAITGKRYDWSGLIYALLAGVVVYILDRPKRGKRR